MLDGFHTALATPGLIWLALTIGVAGIVRGFAGFGTALILVPIGNLFLSSADVIALTVIAGLFSGAALVPRALKVADIKEVSILAVASALTVPVGLWVLSQLDQVAIRWIAAVVSALLLCALISGWRYRGKMDTARQTGVGAGAGVLGGMTGLTGPVVILFYLARATRAEVVRANTILYLALLDVIIVAHMLWQDLIGFSIVAISIILAVPYVGGARIGQALFRAEYEKTYRTVAYTVIALAVITGLPVWD